jgi:hypothetical protein
MGLHPACLLLLQVPLQVLEEVAPQQPLQQQPPQLPAVALAGAAEQPLPLSTAATYQPDAPAANLPAANPP